MTTTDSTGTPYPEDMSACGDFSECHAETPCQHARDAQAIENLIARGADFSVAEDKAFMAGDRRAEELARQGFQATTQALAAMAGVDEATASEMVLTAST